MECVRWANGCFFLFRGPESGMAQYLSPRARARLPRAMSFFGSGSAAMDPRMLLSASMSDNRAWGDLFVDSSSRDGAPAVAPVASAAAAPSAAAAAHFSNDQLLDLLDTTSRDGLNLIVKVRARRSWKGGKKKEKANRLLRGHPTNRLLTPPRAPSLLPSTRRTLASAGPRAAPSLRP
jgi:hypothetical protein